MRKTGVRMVAVVEATKGLLVLAAGAGLFSLVHRDVQAIAEHIVEVFHLNPASRTPRIFLDLAADLTSVCLPALRRGLRAVARQALGRMAHRGGGRHLHPLRALRAVEARDLAQARSPRGEHRDRRVSRARAVEFEAQ
jgi:Predicted membrane protein (DUF2127)